MGRILQVGKRPGRRAKRAAPGQGARGKGQGALGHLFTGGQAGPVERSSCRPWRRKVRQGVARGSHWPSSQGERGSALSHTCTHTCVHMHSHRCTHPCSHTPPHTAFMHIVHSRSCLHVHRLILTHVHVLSGSWLQFWRFKPPRLHLSVEHFSRPPIPSQSPRLCVP